MVRLNYGIKFNQLRKPLPIVMDFCIGCYCPCVTYNTIPPRTLLFSVYFCLTWLGKVVSNQTELRNKESSHSLKKEQVKKCQQPDLHRVTAVFQHLSVWIHWLKREITGLWNIDNTDFWQINANVLLYSLIRGTVSVLSF